MNHLGDTNKMVGEDHIRDATKMVSDTPRTDAKRGFHDLDTAVDAEFSEQLECELNAANESFRKLNIHTLNLVDRIRRLEEAGDAVAAIIGPPGSAHWADENEVDAAWNNWRKAKEAKP